MNAPGRDPIVTRILWLEGLEEQNRNARARAIYIHGTPEESRMEEAVSWGCIRMRSRDIIALYDQVDEGTEVSITTGRLPKLRKYDASRDIIIASNRPVPTETPRTSSLRHNATGPRSPERTVVFQRHTRSDWKGRSHGCHERQHPLLRPRTG